MQKYINIGCFATREEAFKALHEYNTNPYDISRNQITFAEVYDKWSERHFEKIGKSAIMNYRNAYNRYCSSLYRIMMKDIRLFHLQTVIDNCGMPHPTKRVIKNLFNVLFKFAMKNDIVEKDYATYVDVGRKEVRKNRKPFTSNEIKTLWDSAHKLDFVDTVLILIYTGLRIGELLDIKIENVHLEERYMRGGLKTKAGKDRVIPINKKVKPFIRKYYEKNKNSEYLITEAVGKRMAYYIYRREWDNIMEKLGMEQTPHDTRHTFASLMDTAGANKLCIKRIMGHTSQDITDEVYTHKEIGELIAEIDLV